MQETSGGHIVKAILAGSVTAAITGPALVGLLLLTDRFPRGAAFGALVGFIAIGYVAGEAVRRLVGYKLDKRIQYIAGLSVFLAYIAATLVLFFSPTLNNNALGNIVALAGMGVGIWIAMGRVRP